MNKIALSTLLLLSACFGPAPVPDADGCGAAAFADTLGMPIDDVSVPTDRPARVIRPNDMVTADYNEKRINFDVDTLGLVTDITCG
ncbi:hypothetical protein EU805_00385 [Salipiger sp. IMCC34102]|uniref:I78 family peptidase inhibitor n=1 Tax=Salipiger sp. IMCC34102 TaxID=2510647 RepID=UPI00101CCF3C|nr:I78 family peptidase inhibitor [Salipiger sp. IMCC34102]RYH03864.1 hypothetical protein EU805_00385 [Salipiger sp. IMCC34102]